MNEVGRNKRSVLLLTLFYGRSVSFFLRMVIPPFIPFFLDEFGWDSFQIGLLASASLWSYAFTQLLWGMLVDRWGGEKSLVVGWVVMVVSTFIFALALNFEQFMIARFLFGFGAASVLVASTSIITETYRRSERGRAIGILSSSSSIGILIAGISIPWLLASNIQLLTFETWRATAIVITIPGVIALLVHLHMLSKPVKKVREQNLIDSSLQEVSKRSLLRDPRLYLMSIGMIGYIIGFTVTSTWIYAYLHHEYEMSMEFAGTIASLSIFIPGMISPFLSGWLSDRLGSRAKVSATGALFSAVIMFILASKTPLNMLVLSLVVLGFFALFHTPIFSLPNELWSSRVVGTALGFVNELAQISAALTPTITGYMLNVTGGSYEWVWFFGGVFYIMAAFSLLAVMEKPV